MKPWFFFFSMLFACPLMAQDKQAPFSGELMFTAIRVIPADSVKEIMLIYAKDSLSKVVNFSSHMGKQELIKHLGVERSYLLLETTKGNYAVKTDYKNNLDTSLQYSFKKMCGSKKFNGKKAKKLKVTFKDIQKEFVFYYFKDIPAKYGSAFTQFPGLVVEYYLPTDQGVFQYTLTEFQQKDPPLSLFMVPEGYKRVTLELFLEEMAKP